MKIPNRPGLVGEVVDVDHAVVLQVLADRQILAHRDPEELEILGRPDPGEHEQHGRLVRAAGDDDLALGPHRLAHAVADELDADGAIALEDDALDEDVRADLEVGPVRHRMEERVRRAAAHAVALRELEARDALGLVDVQVLDVRVPGVDRGFQLRLDERGHGAAVGHRERAADAVELVLAALVVLGPLEVREHLVVRPARAALLGPAVEVGAVTAEVDHRVDRARASDHPAAREVQAPPAEARLLLAEEVPVEVGLERRAGTSPGRAAPLRCPALPPPARGRETSGSSLRRPASTQPAVPDPTIT